LATKSNLPAVGWQVVKANAMDKKALAKQVAAHRHGRVPRELRRSQVLAEAYELFVERGYQGASMDELARRVGVTKPVVYDLVGSKEQLFGEVMATVQQELAACVASAAAEQPDLTSRLHAGILAFLRFVHRRRKGWAALLSMQSGLGGSEIVTMRREQVALVASLIAESIRRDRESADARTIEALAQAVNGAVELVAHWWQSHPDLSAEALAELLTNLLSPGLVALAGSKRTSARRR